MATFPELVPTTRSYDFGAFPISEVPSASAGVVRFRHGATPQNYSLTISYSALSDADATLIRNHFQLQGGGFRSFALPSAIWTNHSFSGNVAPYKMSWRYTEPIEEEHYSLGLVNLTIKLGSDGLLTDDAILMKVVITYEPGGFLAGGGLVGLGTYRPIFPGMPGLFNFIFQGGGTDLRILPLDTSTFTVATGDIDFERF